MDTLNNTVETDFTQAGEIPIGFLYASVKNVGDVPVIVNGVELAVGEAKGYPFTGKPYNPIPFDPQNSTLRVLYIL